MERLSEMQERIITENLTCRDNKAFWKIVKPNFSEKAIKENITSLVEDDAVLRNKVEIANVMIIS